VSKGFRDLQVVNKCDYCNAYSMSDYRDKACRKCPLNNMEVEGIPICNVSHLDRSSHFWLLVEELQPGKRTDFGTALGECNIILNAVIEGCPDKKRAVMRKDYYKNK